MCSLCEIYNALHEWIYIITERQQQQQQQMEH